MESKGKSKLEISSDQLKSELVEIKERIGALETIATISNKAIVEQHVRAHIKTPQSRVLMKACSEPRTREYLMSALGVKTPQSVDHHLSPLRDNNLIHQHFSETDGVQTFETSKLFRQLPKQTQKAILNSE